MKLDHTAYERMMSIPWFAFCGKETSLYNEVPAIYVQARPIALQSMFSPQWSAATTEAQGRLTSYLAATDYYVYGSTWNKLARESQSMLDATIAPIILRAVEAGGWEDSMANTRLPEFTPAVCASLGSRMVELIKARAWKQCLLEKTILNLYRVSLETTYRRTYRKMPVFFEHLLQVYESGHVPCGWEGDLDNWPDGKLLVH
jgi:hypothetical protein